MKEDSQKVKDPVCLMEIDPAESVGHEDYQGKRYDFCSESCQKAFQQDPERFAKLAA